MSLITKHGKGFTLLELIIVVVIIAILSAIVVPSYQKYILRSHRIEARNTLQELANRMSRQRGIGNSYIKDASGNVFDPKTLLLTKKSKYYDFNFSNVTDSTFTITATAKGSQLNDECTSFSTDQLGREIANNESVISPISKECWGK